MLEKPVPKHSPIKYPALSKVNNIDYRTFPKVACTIGETMSDEHEIELQCVNVSPSRVLQPPEVQSAAMSVLNFPPRWYALPLYEAAFDIIDSDHNERLSIPELRDIVLLLGLDIGIVFPALEEELELSKDGITKVDFLNSLEPFSLLLSAGLSGNAEESELENHLAVLEFCSAIEAKRISRIRSAFLACDLTASGRVSVNELQIVLKALGEWIEEGELEEIYSELGIDPEEGFAFKNFIKILLLKKRKCYSGLDVLHPTMLNLFGDFRQSSLTILWTADDELETKMSFMEAMGVRYMINKSRTDTLLQRHEMRNREQLSTFSRTRRDLFQNSEYIRIKKVEHMELFWAGVAGLISGLLSLLVINTVGNWTGLDGISELTDSQGVTVDASLSHLSFIARASIYWSIVAAANFVFILLELFLLFSVSLNSALYTADILQVKLFPLDRNRMVVTTALARSAMELSPPTDPVFGVNCLIEASAPRRYAKIAMKKSKESLSSFTLKLIVNRGLVRALARIIVPYISVLVNVFWNIVMALRRGYSTRVTLVGPSIVYRAFDELYSPVEDYSQEFKECLIRSISVAIVRTQFADSNMVVMLSHAMFRTQVHPEQLDEVESAALFLQELETMSLEETVLILRILTLTLLVCRSNLGKHITLMQQACNSQGLKHDPVMLRRWKEQFCVGSFNTSEIVQYNFLPEELVVETKMQKAKHLARRFVELVSF